MPAADAYRLGEPLRLLAYAGDHTRFEAPPLADGRRVRAAREAEVGLGLADVLGLRPGSTLAVQLSDGYEVRFRVVGIVRALENEGRMAYVQPDRLLDADPWLTPSVAIRLDPDADKAAVTRELNALGAPPTTVTGAAPDNRAFLAVLAAVLRGVGLAVGLVCVYALVQGLAMTARERRGAIALLRACGGDRGSVARVLGGAAVAVAVPAAGLGIVLEIVSFGPLVARLAAGLRRPAAGPRPAAGSARRGRAARPGRLGRDARRAPRAARARRRGAAGGVMRRRLLHTPPAGRSARRTRTGVLALVLLVVVVGLARCGSDATPAGGGPPGSTLRGTLIDSDGDGTLEPGPAEPFSDRTDLAPAYRPGRVIATLGQLSDTHVRDEESPGRVPFLDRFGGALRSTFRPHEALSTQVLAAAVRSMNAQRPQAVLVTGDLTDNAERNELTQARAVLDGGLVRPDTGRAGLCGRPAGLER